jgi:hypothetical protein
VGEKINSLVSFLKLTNDGREDFPTSDAKIVTLCFSLSINVGIKYDFYVPREII